MKKEFIKYGFYTLVVILTLVFIYPTVYKYDKLNGKIPVKINRITGNTQLLGMNGWYEANNVPTVDFSKYLQPAATPVSLDEFLKSYSPTPVPTPNTYKGETFEQYYDRVTSDLDSKQSIPSKNIMFIEWEKARTGVIANLVEPKDYFTIGSTKDQVKKAMGTPSGIQELYGGGDVWTYEYSTVTFDSNGKVNNYADNGKNLKIK